MLPASQHSGCSPPQAAQFSLDYLRTWTKASAGGCSDYKPMGVYLCLCICVCVCVCICLCAYLCVSVCLYVFIFVPMCVFMCLSMCLCGSVGVECIFVYLTEYLRVHLCLHVSMSICMSITWGDPQRESLTCPWRSASTKFWSPVPS